MKKMEYQPSPIDTSDVTLPAELAARIEDIAKNVHEVWAQSRIEQGWTVGDKRDDALKKHPCLVPYDALPEVERDYDRNTVEQSLKMAMKLGFKISR